MKTGDPQGSMLGPILFSNYINELGKGVEPANVYFYADDTIIHYGSIFKSGNGLQNDFNSFQTSLGSLKLDFTQFRLSLNYVMIQTLNGTQIEIVASYKYLGIWLDDKLTYSFHIDSLLKNLRPTLGFYFRLKKVYFIARKRLVESTLLSVLDYGDIIYMHMHV